MARIHLGARSGLRRWLLILAAAAPGGAESKESSRYVTALRVDRPPRIEGQLSEPAWRNAEAAGGFFRAQQARGTPARLRTEAYVLYDAAAVYVGFRCWEPDMAGLRETLTRRDTRVWHDDAVEVVFDTFHDRRNAYIFGINTLGTQMDQRLSNESSFNFAWDASWEAKVQKQEDQWTAEFAIPLAALQYDDGSTTWGVNFWRAHPIDQEAYSWSDTGGAFGRVSEFGELRGLQLGAARGRIGHVDILPYASYRALESLPDDGDAGIDLIYRPSAGLIGNLTLFPDFSQLESDPTLINVNDDRELSLPERRPFFRDGAGLFDLPLRLFYTRRVQEIDLGIKGTGKTGRYTWAALNTYGSIIDRYDGGAKRRANLLNLRLNRDVGERTVIGAMAVHKDQDDRDYGLLSFNGRLGLGRDWTAAGQFAGSSTGDSPRLRVPCLDGVAESVRAERPRRTRGDRRPLPAERNRPRRRGLPPRPGRPHLPQRVFRGQQSQRPDAAREAVPADRPGRAAARAVRPGRRIVRRRPVRFPFARPHGAVARIRTAVEDAVRRGRNRIRVDERLRGGSTTRSAAARTPSTGSSASTPTPTSSAV